MHKVCTQVTLDYLNMIFNLNQAEFDLFPEKLQTYIIPPLLRSLDTAIHTQGSLKYINDL